MNINELDNLIASLDKTKDKDLIKFYQKKRVELLAEISEKINKGRRKL
jgi:phosphoglycerate-specific signal transduction histidine kinase